MNSSRLPPLAFGDRGAKEFRSMSDATDEVYRLIPALIDCEFFYRDAFRFLSSFANLNGLLLGALSAQPNRIYVGERPEPAVGFAISGATHFKADQALLGARPAQTAVFVPAGLPTDITAGERSSVVARIDSLRLEKTARTMLGLLGDDTQVLTFSNPREIALRLGKVSLDAVFRQLFAQIDAYGEDTTMLSRSGIDEIFYRTLVVAMNPGAFVRQAEQRRMPARVRQVDRICEYIAAHLDSRITLTDLERIGHMSRRNLHYVFLEVFGMSPMGWVREQRLLKARAMLLASSRDVTVADVLYKCGFTKASQFSLHYARRFGELPSATLRKR